MLQKLGDHIANCLARADDADRRASEASVLEIKAESERMASAWRHLATAATSLSKAWSVSCSMAAPLQERPPISTTSLPEMQSGLAPVGNRGQQRQ